MNEAQPQPNWVATHRDTLLGGCLGLSTVPMAMNDFLIVYWENTTDKDGSRTALSAPTQHTQDPQDQSRLRASCASSLQPLDDASLLPVLTTQDKVHGCYCIFAVRLREGGCSFDKWLDLAAAR